MPSLNYPFHELISSSSSCLLWSLHFYMVKLKLRPTTLILSHATMAHALGINGCYSRKIIVKVYKQIIAGHSFMLSSIQSTQLFVIISCVYYLPS